MSDNNTQKGGKRDSFAKPGDESIVSGKSFFLSFGKQKKSNTNPLLESEKNKANAANENKDQKNRDSRNRNQNQKQNAQRQNEDRSGKPTEKNDSPNNNVNNSGKEKNNFKNKNHRRPDRKQNDGRNEKNTSSEVQSSQTVGTPEREDHRDSQKNRNDRNGNHKNQNNKTDKNGKDKQPNRDVKAPDQNKDPNKEQNKEQNKERGRDHNRDRNRRRNDRSNRPADEIVKEKNVKPEQERNDKNIANNSHDLSKRPKHKKEKFVPTMPEEEIKSEELLQPIVDRSGISSSHRGFGMHAGKSSIMAVAKEAALNAKNEPRYIDRNRPLAEQIIEQSRPKTYKNHVTENTETVEVIGVRFREAGKVYYFAPGENKVEKDIPVIVETARGVEYGFCAIPNRHVSMDNIVPPLKPILRIATKDDTERYESNKQLEAGAAKIFREKARALGLEMSLVYVEYTFDNGKLLFYFTADGRVDFRELIKELAAAFRTRIELRQIGVRDEAKIVGGLGICGRPVCCKSFLGEFSQVSIKMAKDQNLFINSSKISGTCGRFMCCIRYEDEVYQKEYERTPKVDAIVETPDGKGVVVESNALKGVVKVLLDDKPEDIAKPFKCTEVKLLGYVKRENENEIPEGAEEIPEE